MGRMTAWQRQLTVVRRENEQMIAEITAQELARVWRQIYPRLRRLDRQRPVSKLRKRSLRKAEFIAGAAIWDHFKNRLHARLMEAMKSGALKVSDVHTAWNQHQAGAVYEGAEFASEDIAESLKSHIGERVTEITDTTRENIGKAVYEWYNTPGEKLGDLVNAISPDFSPRRAQMIARTETTWLNSEVTEKEMDSLGIDEWKWNTTRSEIVCDKCKDRHGKTYHRGDQKPPLHPHCGCDMIPIVDPAKIMAVKPAAYDPSKLPPPPPEPVTMAPATVEPEPVLPSPAAAPEAVPEPITPAAKPVMKLSVNQYVAMKKKAEAGELLTLDEVEGAKAFALKTWGKANAPWIGKAEEWIAAKSVPPIPLTVNQYVELSQKAQKEILSPSELVSAEAFSLKTWKKAPAWMADQKAGKLYVKPEKVKVVKKPAAAPAPVAPPPPPAKPAWLTASGGLDHDMLKQVDLHDLEPTWQNPVGNPRYGAVLIDDDGNILLREPKGHYDDYVWTHAKGGPDFAGEHPVNVVEREVAEETGYEMEIVGIIPGGYSSGYSTTYYFVARPKAHVPHKMDKETINTQWVKPDEARALINMTGNDMGRKRDLAVLQAALNEDAKVRSGSADYTHLFVKPPAPPEPPKPEPKKHKSDKKPTGKPVDVYAQKDGFPTSAQGLKVVRGLGGSTGAQLVEDPATGKQFVMKRGNHAQHLLSEAYADAVYRVTGANVPEIQVYDTPGGPVKLSAYVPNAKPLGEFMANGTPEEIKKVKKKLQKHFAADALLGNWDVIGTSQDNIMVDDKGEVWRIDNGGSLSMRAQGAPKGDSWNQHPVELWTMRGAKRMADDPSPNGGNGQALRNAQALFGDLGYREIMAQARDLVARRDAILASVPDDQRKILTGRLDVLKHLADTSEQMDDSGWGEGYQDGHGRGIVENRKAGIVDRLPARLATKKVGKQFDVTLVDEHGQEFDSLRGSSSPLFDLKKVVERAGGDYDIVSQWAGEQAGDSWSEYPRALKWMLAQNNEEGDKAFWWGNKGNQSRKVHLEKCRKAYNDVCIEVGHRKSPGASLAEKQKIGEEIFQRTFETWHAFTYELMVKTELPYKHPEDGTITLMRSENSSWVEDVLGYKAGDENKNFLRGGAESCSLVNDVYPVHGNCITKQRVPLCNVLGFYGLERSPGSTHGMFLGDAENEVVVMLGKQKGNYYGLKYSYQSSKYYQKDIEPHE